MQKKRTKKLIGGAKKKEKPKSNNSGEEPSDKDLDKFMEKEFSHMWFVVDQNVFTNIESSKSLATQHFKQKRNTKKGRKKVNKISSVSGIQKREKGKSLSNAIKSGYSKGKSDAAKFKARMSSIGSKGEKFFTDLAKGKLAGVDIGTKVQGVKNYAKTQSKKKNSDNYRARGNSTTPSTSNLSSGKGERGASNPLYDDPNYTLAKNETFIYVNSEFMEFNESVQELSIYNKTLFLTNSDEFGLPLKGFKDMKESDFCVTTKIVGKVKDNYPCYIKTKEDLVTLGFPEATELALQSFQNSAKRNLNIYYESIGMYYEFINSIMFLKYRPLILLIDDTTLNSYKSSEDYYLKDINDDEIKRGETYFKNSINKKNFFKLFYKDKNDPKYPVFMGFFVYYMMIDGKNENLKDIFKKNILKTVTFDDLNKQAMFISIINALNLLNNSSLTDNNFLTYLFKEIIKSKIKFNDFVTIDFYFNYIIKTQLCLVLKYLIEMLITLESLYKLTNITGVNDFLTFLKHLNKTFKICEEVIKPDIFKTITKSDGESTNNASHESLTNALYGYLDDNQDDLSGLNIEEDNKTRTTTLSPPSSPVTSKSSSPGYMDVNQDFILPSPEQPIVPLKSIYDTNTPTTPLLFTYLLGRNTSSTPKTPKTPIPRTSPIQENPIFLEFYPVNIGNNENFTYLNGLIGTPASNKGAFRICMLFCKEDEESDINIQFDEYMPIDINSGVYSNINKIIESFKKETKYTDDAINQKLMELGSIDNELLNVNFVHETNSGIEINTKKFDIGTKVSYFWLAFDIIKGDMEPINLNEEKGDKPYSQLSLLITRIQFTLKNQMDDSTQKKVYGKLSPKVYKLDNSQLKEYQINLNNDIEKFLFTKDINFNFTEKITSEYMPVSPTVGGSKKNLHFFESLKDNKKLKLKGGSSATETTNLELVIPYNAKKDLLINYRVKVKLLKYLSDGEKNKQNHRCKIRVLKLNSSIREQQNLWDNVLVPVEKEEFKNKYIWHYYPSLEEESGKEKVINNPTYMGGQEDYRTYDEPTFPENECEEFLKERKRRTDEGFDLKNKINKNFLSNSLLVYDNFINKIIHKYHKWFAINDIKEKDYLLAKIDEYLFIHTRNKEYTVKYKNMETFLDAVNTYFQIIISTN